ncbi:MAG: hypothetical protein ACJ71X_10075 [Nitrososphaeraceae archaeon]
MTSVIGGRVLAKAEALTGPMTPPGKLAQTINPPGSEVGPGTTATWGKSTADQADPMFLNGKEKVNQVSTFDLNGAVHKQQIHFLLVLENLICHSFFCSFFLLIMFYIMIRFTVL